MNAPSFTVEEEVHSFRSMSVYRLEPGYTSPAVEIPGQLFNGHSSWHKCEGVCDELKYRRDGVAPQAWPHQRH
jgi:hypothetical protein